MKQSWDWVWCETNDDCLKYWKSIEKRVDGDMPCGRYLHQTKSFSSDCRWGLRFGCEKNQCWTVSYPESSTQVFATKSQKNPPDNVVTCFEDTDCDPARFKRSVMYGNERDGMLRGQKWGPEPTHTNAITWNYKEDKPYFPGEDKCVHTGGEPDRCM